MAPQERHNEKLVSDAISFTNNYLTVLEGDNAGSKLTLLDWQNTLISDVIGTQVWSDEFDEWVRRYKTVYVEIPRKSGKSYGLSIIALYHLFCDPTLKGQEIICVASTREQAAIVFDTAAKMVRANDELADRCRITERSLKRIENTKNGNTLYVVPGDADSALGLRPAVIIFDELLAQKSRRLFDAITTGQGATKQPLLWMITTAGEFGSICHIQHEYGEAIKSGDLVDPSFYYMRYGMNEGDDWTDEEVWKRCNPSMGKTVSMSWFRSEFLKAQQSLEKQIAFRKFYLNEWNLSETAWLDPIIWELCGTQQLDMKELKGCPVWIGVDLSSRKDITAVVALYKKDSKYHVVPYFFLPEDGIDDKSRRDGVPYKVWANNGFMILTPGRTVNYDAVFQKIIDISQHGSLQAVGYDSWNAGDLEAKLLSRKIKALDVPQGFRLSEALKEIETNLMNCNLEHYSNPVLNWMSVNVHIKINEVGMIKIIKDKNTKRIDGIAALANAFDQAMREPEAVKTYRVRTLN